MAETETLTKSIQCHVCFEEYKVNQKIWQCRSGHSVCQVCRSHLHECPFCKAPYEGTRNYAVEEIVREMKGNLENTESVTHEASVPDVKSKSSIDETTEVLPSEENDHTASSSSSSSSSSDFSDMVVVESPRRDPRQASRNTWIRCIDGEIPLNAIQGGRDHGDEPLFIGRAIHQEDLIPGKVNRKYRKCYVAWGGEEHEKTYFEVLCDTPGTWIPNSGGIIPSGALAAGHTKNGETLYIGRARIEGTLAIGKVHPSHGCCYIPYGGREHSNRNYEIYALDY